MWDLGSSCADGNALAAGARPPGGAAVSRVCCQAGGRGGQASASATATEGVKPARRVATAVPYA